MENLDLGIKKCFLYGMTSQVTVWLPVYVILIVVGLSYASRYFTTVEKLTRKRVILVIATLYLLAMMLVTTTAYKRLFNYRKVQY